MHNCVCVIPARGGSKRILRKNLKEFCGKPILSYSLSNAKKSGIFQNIVVSSEDAEILEFAKKAGVSTFERPKELSDDYTGTRAVIVNAIESLGIPKETFVCCLYATAPLLDFRILREAFEVAQSRAQDCFRAFIIAQGRNQMLFREYFTKRSQDLEKVYHDAGQFYFARAGVWQERENIFEDSVSFLLPQARVADIDTMEDWNLAELKFKQLSLLPPQ